MRTNRATGIITSLLVVLSTAGCAFLQLPPDFNIALRENGGSLEIALCRDTVLAQVSGEKRKRDEDWREVWLAPSTLEISAGSSFAISDVYLNGSPLIAPTLDGGDELVITLTDSEGQTISGDFVVSAEGLPNAQWLLADNSLADAPCEHVI